MILADGERLLADVVVSNADVAFTYKRLVPRHARRVNTDQRLDRLRYSMSLFVIYFGTDRRYDDMTHHEMLLSSRYNGLLRDIFDRQRLAPDFSLYRHRPTATDSSLAPPGCDSWYALSPVLVGDTDWDRVAITYRNAIIDYLEQRYLPGLSRHIVAERQLDPRYFRDTLNTHLGSAFSFEPTLMQSGWFRPHNRSEGRGELVFGWRRNTSRSGDTWSVELGKDRCGNDRGHELMRKNGARGRRFNMGQLFPS